MRPIEVRFNDNIGFDRGAMLLIAFTDNGDGIVVDRDGNIFTTDEPLIVVSASLDWPLTFTEEVSRRWAEPEKEPV
jgi:hypothetical protein